MPGKLRYDLTGQVFGKLTAVSHVYGGSWNVRCECGVEKVVAGGNMRTGGVGSCGTCGTSHLKSGSGHTRWRGDDITYASAHKRVTAARGRAKGHDCLVCGSRATAWAYRGDSPNEQTEWREEGEFKTGLLRYSPDPDDYDPLCWSCHIRKDLAQAKARA